MIFFNSLRPDVFRPEHAEIVQRVAPEIASVLSRCKGPEEAPTHEALARSFEAIGRELRAATAEELLVARVLEQIRDGVVVDDVLDRVFEHFHTLLPYDRIGYATLENDRVEARWARSRMPLRLPRGYHLRLGATSLRGIIESGTPRILDDLVAYFKKHPYSRSTQLIVDEGLRSSLTFFLGTEATPLGFLFFASATPSAYTHAHLARMRRITAPLTAAIWRARLYEEFSQARARSEELLHMLAPAPIAAQLQAGETDIADARVATILFADLVEFTRWSTPLSPVELLHTLRELFARIHDSAMPGVARIRVMGDGYMAAAGAADDAPDHAVRAALHALDILDIVADTRTPDGQRIAVRVGLHTGFVVAGVLGGGDLRFDVWGPAVSVAARLESHGVAGRIQVSADTADRLRGRFALEPQEPVALKGLGPTPVWWLSRLR